MSTVSTVLMYYRFYFTRFFQFFSSLSNTFLVLVAVGNYALKVVVKCGFGFYDNFSPQQTRFIIEKSTESTIVVDSYASKLGALFLIE